MREIKFRGWERELQTMVYDTELGGWIFEYNGNPVRAVNQMINEEDYFYDLMQYTGLKDKNGEEIYEGDVLKWDGGRTGISKLPSDYIIEVLKSKHLDIELEEHTNSYMFNYDTSGYTFPGFLEEAEITGNIYENPELLERK